MNGAVMSVLPPDTTQSTTTVAAVVGAANAIANSGLAAPFATPQPAVSAVPATGNVIAFNAPVSTTPAAPVPRTLPTSTTNGPTATAVASTALAAALAPAAPAINPFEALFGKVGEGKIESLDSDKKFCAGLFANGVFERRVTNIGTFVRQLAKCEIPYLTEKCAESFQLSLPKIPAGMFYALHDFYAHVTKTIKSEVAAQIFWDMEEKRYIFNVPEQTVSGSTVDYKRDSGVFADPRYVLAICSHSHNTFGAFFSGVDTGSEIGTGMFLVIGNVDKPNPSVAFRAGCNSTYLPIKLAEIFDETDTAKYNIDHSLLANIKERYVAPVTTGNYQGAYRGYNSPNSYQYPGLGQNTGKTNGTTQNGGTNVGRQVQNVAQRVGQQVGSHLRGGKKKRFREQNGILVPSPSVKTDVSSTDDYDSLLAQYLNEDLSETMDLWEAGTHAVMYDPNPEQTMLHKKYFEAAQLFQDTLKTFLMQFIDEVDEPSSDELITSFVSMMDDLGFNPLSTLKALYDESSRGMKQTEVNDFIAYASRT